MKRKMKRKIMNDNDSKYIREYMFNELYLLKITLN